MEDKLKTEVEKAVKQIFASKKEDEARKRTEVALIESANTIEALTVELTSSKESATELSAKLVAAEESVKTLEEEKANTVLAAENTVKEQTELVESLTKDVAKKDAELADIKQEALATSRMGELVSAGVARDDREAQTSKVKIMSEEEFASYKSELLSVRESILAELKTKAEVDAAAVVTVDEVVTATDDDDTVATPPANIDPGQSVAAAMNMEIYPSDDLIAQYTAMGKAMAAAMTKEK
jgi:hypothetical protein